MCERERTKRWICLWVVHTWGKPITILHQPISSCQITGRAVGSNTGVSHTASKRPDPFLSALIYTQKTHRLDLCRGALWCIHWPVFKRFQLGSSRFLQTSSSLSQNPKAAKEEAAANQCIRSDWSYHRQLTRKWSVTDMGYVATLLETFRPDVPVLDLGHGLKSISFEIPDYFIIILPDFRCSACRWTPLSLGSAPWPWRACWERCRWWWPSPGRGPSPWSLPAASPWASRDSTPTPGNDGQRHTSMDDTSYGPPPALHGPR